MHIYAYSNFSIYSILTSFNRPVFWKLNQLLFRIYSSLLPFCWEAKAYRQIAMCSESTHTCMYFHNVTHCLVPKISCPFFTFYSVMTLLFLASRQIFVHMKFLYYVCNCFAPLSLALISIFLALILLSYHLCHAFLMFSQFEINIFCNSKEGKNIFGISGLSL